MSQILYFISPRTRGEFKSELISGDWMAGIFHSFKPCSNLVLIHRKATCQRAEYSQIMTQNNAFCINPLQLYHTVCIYRPLLLTLQVWTRPAMEVQWDVFKKAGFDFAIIISCVLALNLYGCEWCRRRKNPPSVLQFRIAGLAKEGVGSSKYSGCKHISPSHWEQNKYPNPQMTLFQFEVWSLVC